MDEHNENVLPIEPADAKRSHDSGVADSHYTLAGSHFKGEASDVVFSESLDGAANGHSDLPVASGRAAKELVPVGASDGKAVIEHSDGNGRRVPGVIRTPSGQLVAQNDALRRTRINR